MQTILKIGYQSFLFTDHKTAARAFELLSTALPVRNMLHAGALQEDAESGGLSLEALRKPFKFVDKNGKDTGKKAPKTSP